MFKSGLISSILCVCAFVVAVGTADAASGGGFQWEEKDGKIVRQSVCIHHGYGSIKYRQCRARAAAYFKQQCQSLSDKIDNAYGSSRSRYKLDQKKFCHAARHFRIVNLVCPSVLDRSSCRGMVEVSFGAGF